MRTFGSPSAKIRAVGVKPPTRRKQDQMFRPYALEIGKFALEWNRLHENLYLLFSAALGEGENMLLAYKVWHSLQSDRAQREMLRAAAQVTFATDAQKRAYPKALNDTIWLLDRTQSLANRRNDALHSPFILSFSESTYSVQPDVFFGHPRASSFEGKNVLVQIKCYRDHAIILHRFAYKLFYCLKVDALMKGLAQPHPWPERPKLRQLASSTSHNRNPRTCRSTTSVK